MCLVLQDFATLSELSQTLASNQKSRVLGEEIIPLHLPRIALAHANMVLSSTHAT